MTLAQIQPRDAVQVKPCASRAGFLFLLPMTAIFKPDITGQMSEITMSEDLQATLAQVETRSLPALTHCSPFQLYPLCRQRPLAASSASRQRGKERSATPGNLHATCREPELTRAPPLDLNHNARFHTHIRLSIYVFDGHRPICPLSQGAHPNSHRAMQSSQRLDSLTPASSPVRVTHLCRTASRWLHSRPCRPFP